MKPAARRALLRDRLIDLAQARIEASGPDSLKARDLAAEAGCSIGSIYNVFSDIDDLVIAVNGRTFLALGTHVTDAGASKAAGPKERMLAMSLAYHDFAMAHSGRWLALFDASLITRDDLPEWYLAALDDLYAMIDAPLAEIFPHLASDEIRLRARALFFAVHGVVRMAVEQQSTGAGETRVQKMITFLLHCVSQEN